MSLMNVALETTNHDVVSLKANLDVSVGKDASASVEQRVR